jgi:hypothetical protein
MANNKKMKRQKLKIDCVIKCRMAAEFIKKSPRAVFLIFPANYNILPQCGILT